MNWFFCVLIILSILFFGVNWLVSFEIRKTVAGIKVGDRFRAIGSGDNPFLNTTEFVVLEIKGKYLLFQNTKTLINQTMSLADFVFDYQPVEDK